MREQTRVLVVDDERFFREAIRELLEGEGIDCALVGTAAEALERAAEPEIGVLVLDIQLPDQSGLEVLRTLREVRPELRVVVLSAHTDQAYVLEALRLGACDYLAKPLHEEEMRLSVRRALEAYRVAAGFQGLRDRVGALADQLESLRAVSVDESLGERAARAAELVARVLGARKTSVMLLDEAGEALQVAGTHGRKTGVGELASVPLGDGVAGLAVARGESILVEDVTRDPRFEPAPGRTYDSDSFLVAPLASGSECFGAVCATDRRAGGSFEADDGALLRVLAHAFGPLLVPEGASAAASGPQDSAAAADPRDAELARRVCEAITREVEPSRMLQAALEAVCGELGAAPAAIFLLDAVSGELRAEAQWEGAGGSDRAALPSGRGLTGAALESGQPVATDAPDRDPRFDAEVDTAVAGSAAPLLVVPLRFRSKSLGVFRAFGLGATTAPRAAEVLGAALSAAVRNVLLYRSLVASMEEVAEVRREAAGG